jgi:glycerol-3-phosphate dehydrogenase subunit B
VRRAADVVAARAPRHPYTRIGSAGRERLREALAMLKELARGLELMERDDGHNHVLATTALIGVVQLSDLAGFDARPVAHMLAWSGGFGKKPLSVMPLVVPRTVDQVHHTPLELALRLDDPARRAAVVDAVRAVLRAGARVPSHLLFPAALGVENVKDVVQDLERATGKPARELLATTQSVPGERLSRALVAGLKERGVTVVDGAVSATQVAHKRVHKVSIDGARVKLELVPKAMVLATGRFFSGGIVRDQVAREPILDLPVIVGGAPLSDRFVGDLLGQKPAADHALFRAGVRVDDRMRPVDDAGAALFDNVACAGTVVEGWDPARDGTAGGVAALTGLIAGEQCARAAKEGRL